MKACPQCGFEGTISNNRILRLFNKHFPGLPVLEMIQRGWIRPKVFSQWLQRDEWCNDEIPELLAETLSELQRFFDAASLDELKAICGWEGDLMDVDETTKPRQLQDAQGRTSGMVNCGFAFIAAHPERFKSMPKS
jgi:hypothetical protein